MRSDGHKSKPPPRSRRTHCCLFADLFIDPLVRVFIHLQVALFDEGGESAAATYPIGPARSNAKYRDIEIMNHKLLAMKRKVK